MPRLVVCVLTLLASVNASFAGEPKKMSIPSFLETVEAKFLSRAQPIVEGWMNGQLDLTIQAIVDPSGWFENLALNTYDIMTPKPFSREELGRHIRDVADGYWKENCGTNPSESCKGLQKQLFGAAITNGFILNQNHGDLQAELLNQLLPSNPVAFSDVKSVIVSLMQYSNRPSAVNLQTLSWSFSKSSKLITGSAPTWDGVIDDPNRNPRVYVNNFRIYGVMLRRCLENQSLENVSRPKEIADLRLRNLLPHVKKYVAVQDSGKDTYLSATEFYSTMGTLMSVYEADSNYPRLQDTIVERGWARSRFRELTPNCLTRISHRLWGAWTNFGTSILGPLAWVFVLFFINLVVVGASYCCRGKDFDFSILNGAFELMTLRGKDDLLPRPLRLVLEVVSTGYLGILFSYLVAFFSNFR